MCAPTIQRTLVMDSRGYVLSGGKAPIRMRVRLRTRGDFTVAAERLFARMSRVLHRLNIPPYACEVTVSAPTKLNFGFQRHGLRVRFHEPEEAIH